MKLPRLKEVRELHGWSQTRLAEESDVSRDSISNYETGQREAYPATAKKLADALGVGIADLIEPARELALPKAEAPSTSGLRRNREMAPRASKERLEEYFDNVSDAEVDYLNETLADLWRLALPEEKPQAHFVPDDIDEDRVWRFLNKVLNTPSMFTPELRPEDVERFNEGTRRRAVAGV